MRQKRVLTVGGATLDIFITYKEIESMRIERKQGNRSCLLLEEGAKIEVSNIIYTTGGGATNSAVSFKKLGFSASVCCRLGNDPQAEYILEKLEINALDYSYIQRDINNLSGTSFILPSPCSNNTILAYRGSNAYLSYKDILCENLREFDVFYITSLSGHASDVLIPLSIKAQELGIPIAINPGSSQLAAAAHTLKDALEYIDIFILNSDEAQQFMQALSPDKSIRITARPLSMETNSIPRFLEQNTFFNLPGYCQKIFAQGPRIVVVTDGKEGVYVAHEGIIYFHPSIPTFVKSTVGAGDAFGSCFVASIMHGLSIQESMVRGILNASSVINHLTAKEGLLSTEALEEKIKAYTVSRIQAFKIIA